MRPLEPRFLGAPSANGSWSLAPWDKGTTGPKGLRSCNTIIPWDFWFKEEKCGCYKVMDVAPMDAIMPMDALTRLKSMCRYFVELEKGREAIMTLLKNAENARNV